MGIATSEIIQQIYGTVEQPDSWQQVLHSISEHLDSTHAFIAARSSVSDEPVGFFESGFDAGYFERYQAHFYQVDVWTQGLARHRFNQFHPSHAVCDDKAFLQSEIYNDFARPAAIRHSIGCLLTPQDDDVITELAFMSGADRQHFSAPQIAAANCFLPHIEHSLGMARRLHASGSRNGDLYSILDNLAEAVVVCDGRDRILYSNRSAETLFRDGTLLSKRFGIHPQLQFGTSASQTRFEELAQDCLISLRGGSRQRRQFFLQTPATHYRVSIKPWLHNCISPWGMTKVPSLIITVHATATQLELDAAELAREFGLTQAESAVCCLLSKGLTLTEIAAQRGSTANTIRQQIKSCLAKTETRNQAELVNRFIRHFAVL